MIMSKNMSCDHLAATILTIYSTLLFEVDPRIWEISLVKPVFYCF